MKVQVFLSCCGGENLVGTVNEAIKLSGVNAEVETVSDMIEVVKAGIMSTPAIKINNKLVVSGRVPKVQDLVASLKNEAAKES